jgi:hypothetical protein
MMNVLTLNVCAKHLHLAYLKALHHLHDSGEFPHLRVLVVRTCAEAPSTLEALYEACRWENVVRVAIEHGEHSIYGIKGNLAFRFLHDLGHLMGNYAMEYDDEVALALHQWPSIAKHIPHEWRAECQRVYFADTIGQSIYCKLTGTFPANQRDFVLQLLTIHKDGDSLEQSVAAALAADYAPVLREFCQAIRAHNEAVVALAATRQRLGMAAGRFMRTPQYPYGKQALGIAHHAT